MSEVAAQPRVLSVVLAGGEGKRLSPLTLDRAKPAVPFGGHYRLIDFPLSNLANGGTIGFKCDSPEQVKELHDVAVAHGGTSVEDPPGLRESAMGAMHLSYVLDPDGNKLCGLYRVQ